MRTLGTRPHSYRAAKLRSRSRSQGCARPPHASRARGSLISPCSHPRARRTGLAAERPWSAGAPTCRAAVAERLLERSIQPQAGDRCDASAAHGVEEQQGREATVSDYDKVAFAQPGARLRGELTTDIEQRLRRPRSRQARSGRMGAVRNVRSQTPPAHGTGASRIRLIQRSLLALTKWLSEGRTGSR